jgi:CDP-diacylglycerol--glycerol-3-phosphate 3-phosphatidyltransferase
MPANSTPAKPSRAPTAAAAARRARRESKRAARAQRRELKAARRKTLWEDARNLPNLLTFARVLMIPIVLWFLSLGTPVACFYATLVYALAAITDLLDGWLARRQGLVSVLGKFLDPLADKLIVACTLVWLVPMGRISSWAVALLISREITITALRSIASTEGIVIAAGDGGKTKTALQMVGIICLILGYPYRLDFGIYDLGLVDLVTAGRALVYLSLVFSITSAARYVGLFVDAIDEKNRRQAA